jgi:hypothetical protein
MTTGSINDDKRVLFQPYQVEDDTGAITLIGTPVPVGWRYQKTWTGTDYGHTFSGDIFEYWAKRLVDGEVSFVKVHRKRRPPRRHIEAQHPYSSVITVESNSVYALAHPQTKSHAFVRDFPDTAIRPLPDFVSQWKSNDTIALQGALREMIAGSDFNLGVFLGESHEALSMITKAASSLFRAYKSLKRGDVGGLADALGVPITNRKRHASFERTPKGFAGKWLEYQYGWAPLLKDTYGAAQFLAQTCNFPFKQRYRVRRRKSLTYNSTSDIIRKGGDYFARGYSTGQLIAIVSEVNVPALAGLLDPASVAWELMPYSFVADWFLPIGSYLQARGLASAITGTFVTTITERQFFVCNAFEQYPNQKTVSGPNYRYIRVQVDRTVASNLQVPLPNFKPLGQVLSWKHCANAVALLTQRFSSAR